MHDLTGAVGGGRAPYVDRLVADRPFEGRLQVEALALALLVVGGDLLGRLRGDVLDAVGVAHHLGVAERVPAGVAHGKFIVEVARTAARADAHRLGGEFRIGCRRIAVTERQERPHDPVGLTFVVDEAARAELGEREEARALQVGLPPAAIAARRDVGEQGEPGEIVPRQETLGGEVPVGVEVARQRGGPTLEQVELVHRLRVARLRGALLLVGGGVVVHGPARGIALLLGGGKQVAPTMEGVVEALRGRRHDGARIGIPARVPGCDLRREFILYQVEDAPNPFPCAVGHAAFVQ